MNSNDKYGVQGAFAGTFARWDRREEYWGYMATFLNTTQTAELRRPYLDLAAILQRKDFFILTTNQDTQFVKLYPEEKVSQIQGDHRFFQCARCCTDDTWDAVEPVKQMVEAMGESTFVPSALIPKCPHCGGEAFPWVRGYGNFLQGRQYHQEYWKISDYLQKNMESSSCFSLPLPPLFFLPSLLRPASLCRLFPFVKLSLSFRDTRRGPPDRFVKYAPHLK